MRDYLNPRIEADMLYRKLASRQPVITREGGLSNRYVGRR